MKTRLTILLLILITFLKAQDRFDLMEEKLNQLAKNYPGLEEKVELSVTSVSIQEFIRAIGTSNNLNVTVEPNLDIKITNNFKNITAKDVFVFLCKKFELEIAFIGPVMSFSKYLAPVKLSVRKNINVTYE